MQFYENIKYFGNSYIFNNLSIYYFIKNSTIINMCYYNGENFKFQKKLVFD